ncbi:MAG TPA: hypothetical protein VMU09_06815 [Acidimicrobiales bacterium]|nr:hypothetical protein [Acidimicrobiales bacterium]
MPAPGRPSLFVLAALAVLTAGAVALSLATSPPVAEQQLYVGAGATAGVGSFVMSLTNTVTTRAALPGRPPQVQRSSVRFVYQAPDRIDETLTNANGRAVEIICIGNSRWERAAGGHWVRIPGGATGAVSTCQSAVDTVVLVPANAAANGTPVVRHGQTSNATYTYGLAPADLAAVFRILFGVPATAVASHAFAATVDKEYVVSQLFHAAAGDQTDDIGVRYSELGTAPAVTPPPSA